MTHLAYRRPRSRSTSLGSSSAQLTPLEAQSAFVSFLTAQTPILGNSLESFSAGSMTGGLASPHGNNGSNPSISTLTNSPPSSPRGRTSIQDSGTGTTSPPTSPTGIPDEGKKFSPRQSSTTVVVTEYSSESTADLENTFGVRLSSDEPPTNLASMNRVITNSSRGTTEARALMHMQSTFEVLFGAQRAPLLFTLFEREEFAPLDAFAPEHSLIELKALHRLQTVCMLFEDMYGQVRRSLSPSDRRAIEWIVRALPGELKQHLFGLCIDNMRSIVDSSLEYELREPEPLPPRDSPLSKKQEGRTSGSSSQSTAGSPHLHTRPTKLRENLKTLLGREDSDYLAGIDLQRLPWPLRQTMGFVPDEYEEVPAMDWAMVMRAAAKIEAESPYPNKYEGWNCELGGDYGSLPHIVRYMSSPPMLINIELHIRANRSSQPTRLLGGSPSSSSVDGPVSQLQQSLSGGHVHLASLQAATSSASSSASSSSSSPSVVQSPTSLQQALAPQQSSALQAGEQSQQKIESMHFFGVHPEFRGCLEQPAHLLRDQGKMKIAFITIEFPPPSDQRSVLSDGRTNRLSRVIIRTPKQDIQTVCPENVRATREARKFLSRRFPDVLGGMKLIPCKSTDELHRALVRVDQDDVFSNSQYKFGVLYCKQGDVASCDDTPMYANTEGSEGFNEFLRWLGKCVDLEVLKAEGAFLGGLNWVSGQTVVSSYHALAGQLSINLSIVFHVSTMLPFSAVENSQQLDRKAHIGNDHVVIIYNDDTQPFDPRVMRSHFNHVFFVISKEGNDPDGCPIYRLVVMYKEPVPPCFPLIGTERSFRADEAFHRFLLTKMINAERVARAKAPSFSSLNERARGGIILDIARKFARK